jgi:hypothetical protein
MRGRVKALEEPDPRNQLAWLVLRVLAKLSPCTERSLFAYVAAGESKSEVGHTTYAPHRGELIGNALLKLERLAFIQFAQTQIAITNEGRRFLDELPVIALGLDDRSAKTSRSWSDPFEGINGVLQAKPWTRYIALLKEFTATLLPTYIPRLKRFCQDCLAGTGTTLQGFLMNGVRARDVAREVWRRKGAPIVRSRAATLVHVMTRLAKVCRTCAEAAALATTRSGGGFLWKAGKARYLSLNAKLAGLSRLVVASGALLLVALSTAGGVALLSGKRAESTQETPIVNSRVSPIVVNSRVSPIVWFYDGQDPKQSIFVKRKFAGATWIEGISIRGENTSNQPLTAVQAILISDTGDEIELTVNATGSQQTQADAHDVPSGSEFTLEYGFRTDASGQQAGMPAEKFLSKYGGMIFKFRYTIHGVQRTLIEYFSSSRLKAQLVDAEHSEQGI